MSQPGNNDDPYGGFPPQPPSWVTAPPSPEWGPPAPLHAAPAADPAFTEISLNQHGTVTRRRRRIGRLVPLAIGSVLVLGGAGFVVTNAANLGGDKNSPEQAVEQLFAALDKEDVIGMLEAVTPAERDALVDPVRTMRDHLVRLGVASQELDLRNLKGFDLQVENLKVRSTPLSDTVAMVEATAGQLISISHPGALPVGATLTKLLDDNDESLSDSQDEVHTTELSAGGGTRLMVIKRDGRWAVSLGYSVFEVARRASGKPMPAFGSGAIKPLGADTPEEALNGLAKAVADGDLEAIIGHLDPLEAASAYDYVPLYLKDARQTMHELDRSVHSLSLDTAATGKGDRRMVTVKGFKAVVDSGGDQVSADWDGRCMTTKVSGEKAETVCSDDKSLEGGMGQLSELFDLEALTSMGVAVHQVGGKWYVSPTRTVLDNLNVYLGAVHDDALDQLPDLVSSMMYGFGNDSYDDSYDSADDPTEDPADSLTAKCFDRSGKVMDCSDSTQPVRPAAPTTTARKGF